MLAARLVLKNTQRVAVRAFGAAAAHHGNSAPKIPYYANNDYSRPEKLALLTKEIGIEKFDEYVNLMDTYEPDADDEHGTTFNQIAAQIPESVAGYFISETMRRVEKPVKFYDRTIPAGSVIPLADTTMEIIDASFLKRVTPKDGFAYLANMPPAASKAWAIFAFATLLGLAFEATVVGTFCDFPRPILVIYQYDSSCTDLHVCMHAFIPFTHDILLVSPWHFVFLGYHPVPDDVIADFADVDRREKAFSVAGPGVRYRDIQ